MVMTVSSAFNASEEAVAAASYPQLRLLTLGQGSGAPPALPWSRASPAAVGGAEWSHFSAVCWAAGRRLADALGGDVPLGLMVSAAGATCIEKWLPDAALAQCGQPSGQGLLFDWMIAPLSRQRLRGVFWYQGESNVGTPHAHSCGGWGGPAYACLLSALVAHWRDAFQQPALFFGIVQLAAYSPPLFSAPPGAPRPRAEAEALAELRAAQAAAAAAADGCALVPALDAGDAESPHRSVHPRAKAVLGARLAAAAAAAVYDLGPAAAAAAPRLASARVEARAGGFVAVARAAAGSGEAAAHAPLALRNSTCPGSVPPAACRGLELRDAGGEWHEADVSVEGGEAVAASDALLGAAPTGVRYGWADWPLASLYGLNGLPMLPFQTELQVL